MKTQQTVPTFESVWALLQENALQMKENERILNEKFAETDRLLTKLATNVHNLNVDVGGIGDSQGSFAEEYFFNSFKRGEKDFFGNHFNTIEKNIKPPILEGLQGEYDIVMYNNDSLAIIEVKFKAREKNIAQVLKKAETFKILSPYYKDFKIYLGLAALTFDSGVEEECIEKGIAVIKQMGDAVVINDENLKTF